MKFCWNIWGGMLVRIEGQKEYYFFSQFSYQGPNQTSPDQHAAGTLHSELLHTLTWKGVEVSASSEALFPLLTGPREGFVDLCRAKRQEAGKPGEE